MKKILVLLALVFPVVACADKPIELNRLPESARAFIDKHFADAKVSIATVDKDLFETSYDVTFTDGSTVEFDSKGEWKDVDCKRNPLPEGIVPEAIARHIETNYPDNFARDINRDRRDWEVSLNNGLDLKFDTKFRLIEVDD